MKTLQLSEDLINDIQEYNDAKFNIENSIEDAKYHLQLEMNEQPLSSCNFEDNIWYLFSELHSDRRIIDFNELKELIQFNKSIDSSEFITIVKCWTASLFPTYTVQTIHNYVRGIKVFLSFTKGLNGLNADDISDDFECMTETMKKDACLSAFNLFDYYTNFDNHEQIISLLHELKKLYKIESNVRVLPPSKDILLFSKIVDNYFSTPLTDDEYFRWFPVWLWWKLTNLIPLRPSEFCDIKRECLLEIDGNYYIQLPRKKQKGNLRKIQVIDKINIPEEIYGKLKDYKIKTDKFGKTQTLISYLSIPHFMDERYFTGTNHNKKLVPTTFTLGVFRRILDSFYNLIVFGKYNIKFDPDNSEGFDFNYITQKIRPGDTRHLAFINLMRQGYHSVEIARIGGHTSLQSQNHYFKHITNFVDLEILELIASTDLDGSLNKISKSKSESQNNNLLGLSFADRYVLRPSSTGFKRKMKEGYCTDPLQNCTVEDCWECDSWRISQEEFTEKKPILEQKIKDSQSSINEVVNNLRDLYQSIHSNIGFDEYYSSENPELRKQLINHSKHIDKAVSKYINLLKVKERIDSIGNKG